MTKNSSKNSKDKLNELRGKSAEQWSEKLWQNLVKKLATSKSPVEIEKLLAKLISANEKKILLRRLAAVALLRAGKSSKEISEILWLSPNTISTIKKNAFGSVANYKSYRGFYGRPIARGALENKNQQYESVILEEIIATIGGIFDAFFHKGMGVLNDKLSYKPRRNYHR